MNNGQKTTFPSESLASPAECHEFRPDQHRGNSEDGIAGTAITSRFGERTFILGGDFCSNLKAYLEASEDFAISDFRQQF